MLGAERVGYLLAGDGAEEPAALSGLGLDAHHHAGEPLCVLLGLRLFLGHLRGLCLFLELYGVERVRRGLARQFARQQIVARVAVGDLFHLALLALSRLR